VTGSPSAFLGWSRAGCRLAELTPPRAIILDIEGTTTPIAFVRDVLFPYARARLPAVLRDKHQDPDIAALIYEATQLAGGRPLGIEEVTLLFLTWCDADLKLPPLKALQGIVWRQGYLDGTLRSPVYPDVPQALRKWRARGIDHYVYSSGSVDAQRLLFRYSDQGDLTVYFRGYFDATIGPKTAADSYRAIQRAIGHHAADLLFLSDSSAEIAAARSAGWQALLVERDGPMPGREPPAIACFSELDL
jgi:enolase-phosphatase E1